MKKIVFFSGSRAEYNIQFPLLKLFQNNKNYKFYFIVAGSHTSNVVGDTFKEIKKDKIKVTHKINLNLKSENNLNLNNYSIELQSKVTSILKKIKPDCVLLTSDRFETLSVALVSHFMKIPIIHLEGGDVTEGGTLDDNSRHAITKLSSLHLVTNKDSKKRVNKLGEENRRIIDIGFPPLNMIDKKKLFNKYDIEKMLKVNKEEKVILFTYHPVPNEIDKIKLIFRSLKSLQSKYIKIIITYPNFDPGYKYVIKEIKKLKNENIVVVQNLGRKMYFSILNYLGTYNKGICMGNSSSGIKETLFFNCKTINLGTRQKSRLKTKNIFDCELKVENITKKTKKILKLKTNFRNILNPYYSKKKFNNLDKKILKLLKLKDLNRKKITY
jgi:UDP-hydrolysing UDP-N-acetyl-D-glucosamine 2-epimerase